MLESSKTEDSIASRSFGFAWLAGLRNGYFWRPIAEKNGWRKDKTSILLKGILLKFYPINGENLDYRYSINLLYKITILMRLDFKWY